EHIGRGRFRRFALQREVHALMTAVLLRVPRPDPFDLDSQSQPPDRQLTEPIDGMRRRKRDAVVGANQLRQAEFLEGAREVGDREGVAVLAIAEKKLAFVVGTPERIRLGGAGQRSPRGAWPPAAPM